MVPEANGRVTVYGSTCAEIGDTAFRHGVPVHQLADEIGDTGPAAPPPDGTEAHRPAADLSELPPPIRARPPGGRCARSATSCGAPSGSVRRP